MFVLFDQCCYAVVIHDLVNTHTHTLKCGVLEILLVLLCTVQHGSLINTALMSLSTHMPTEI